MDRRLVLTIGMVLTVVLAGCAGGSGGGQAPETTQPASEDGAAPTGQSDEVGLDPTAELQGAQAQRYRIKKATYELEVDDFDAARESLRSAVTDAGGYVGGETFETHSRNNVSWRTGTVVLRVPIERYGEVVSAVESTGNVTSKDSNTVDVTGKVVDLQARLANLRAQRERLRGMYNRSGTTEDLLKVQERLSSVQGDIERLEGQLRTLENKIAYSTITVELTEDHVDPSSIRPDVDHWYEQGLAAAFLDSVDGVIVLTRMLSVFVASALPYAAFLGLFGGVLLVARRVLPTIGMPSLGRRFRDRDTSPEESADGDEGEDE